MEETKNIHGEEINRRLKVLGKSKAELFRSPLCRKAGVSYNQINGYLCGFHGINGNAFLAIANQLSKWESEVGITAETSGESEKSEEGPGDVQN